MYNEFIERAQTILKH